MLSVIKKKLHELKVRFLKWRVARLKQSAARYFSLARASYKAGKRFSGDIFCASSERKEIRASQISVCLQFLQSN
jgi:hypothetical protein